VEVVIVFVVILVVDGINVVDVLRIDDIDVRKKGCK
jgi:hypothetical protein